MADIGIWGLGAIASPAATDRLPLESGVGAGGRSERSDFAWKTVSGHYLMKSSGEIARLETTTARGSGAAFVGIYDPTGRKGAIGYVTSTEHIYVRNDLTGHVIIATDGINRWLVTSTGSFEPDADNAYPIGRSGARATVIYAATGTINTSDATEKEWLGSGFSSAELSAAKRISAEIGSYKWLEAIARENGGGPAARIHFGPRAQAVWAIMADEGLIDPIEEGVTPSCAYAFLCWDPMEDGDTVGRFGIRPDQLALFLIAAQEARIAAIEAAL